MKLFSIICWILIVFSLGNIFQIWITNLNKKSDFPPFVGTVTLFDKKDGKMIMSWNIWEGDKKSFAPFSPYVMTFKTENQNE